MGGLLQTMSFIQVFCLNTHCCKTRANSAAHLEFLGQKMSWMELSQLLVVLLSTSVLPEAGEKREYTGPGHISKWDVKEVQGM